MKWKAHSLNLFFIFFPSPNNPYIPFSLSFAKASQINNLHLLLLLLLQTSLVFHIIMSFEVDRPIRLLADPSELLKDGLNHHALTNPANNNNRTNTSCVSDLPHHHHVQQQPSTGNSSTAAGVSSPTYSIASSSLSSNSAASSTIYSNSSATHDGAYDGGSDSSSSTKQINGVSNKSTSSSSNLYMYQHDVSPRQRGMNYNSKSMGAGGGYDNKHLLSPVPDCLDHDPTAAAAAAVAACTSGVNEHCTPTPRVPLPTPPASGGTPPQQTWRDMDRRYDFAPRSSMSHPYWAPSTTSSMCMPPAAAAPPLYHELLPQQQQQHPSYWMSLHHQQQHPIPPSSSLLESRRSPYHPSSHHHHPYPTTTTTTKKSLHADPGTANKVVSSTATPRRYKCTVCVKRFTRPSSLATHMHSHTGEVK